MCARRYTDRMVVAFLGTIVALVAVAAAASPAPPHAPAPPAQCQETLREAGLKFSPWPLRPSRLPGGVVCEAPDGIAVRRGPGLAVPPPSRPPPLRRTGFQRRAHPLVRQAPQEPPPSRRRCLLRRRHLALGSALDCRSEQ